MTGMFESTRISSAWRVTPTFRRTELNWVRTVVIWTPESAATSRSFFPASSAAATRGRWELRACGR